EVDPGSERSVAAALSHRASAVLADTPARALELVVRAMRSGLGSVLVLVGRDPRELVDLPVVERDQLLASTVPAVTADGIGWDPGRGELWFAGETAEAVLLELDARRRELQDEVTALTARAAEAAANADRAAERAEAAATAFAPVAHLRNVRRAEPARLERPSGPGGRRGPWPTPTGGTPAGRASTSWRASSRERSGSRARWRCRWSGSRRLCASVPRRRRRRPPSSARRSAGSAPTSSSCANAQRRRGSGSPRSTAGSRA